MKIGIFNPLNLKKEINEVKKYGKIYKNDFFHTKYLKKNSNKIAFILSRKIGNAVTRNRIKRRIRNILNLYNNKKTSFYILLIIKQKFDALTYTQLTEQLNKTLDSL